MAGDASETDVGHGRWTSLPGGKSFRQRDGTVSKMALGALTHCPLLFPLSRSVTLTLR